MARIANKYLPIQQIDPQTPNLFLAQLIGAKDFRRDVILRIIYDEQEWEQALQNAKKCAHLHHSNIVQTLDVGQHNDFWYVAYEFIESLTLEELLGQKIPLTIDHIVYICTEILMALHYAQTQNAEPVFHNNLTPSQVLLTKQGGLKIRGFSVDRKLETSSVYQNPYSEEPQKQDIYSVGKLLESLLSLCSSPTAELMRISVQACAKEKEVQFRSPKAMYDILLLRFPLKGTTSVDLAQHITAQSFEEWEEQPTFISRTLTIKDTQVFVIPNLIAEQAPETFPLETKELPPPPNKTHFALNQKTALYIVVGTGLFLMGTLLGFSMRPSPTFKAMVPKGISLQANGAPFSEISQQTLDSGIKLEILHNDTIVHSNHLKIEPNQNFIIVLPLEMSSQNPSP